MKFDVEYRKSVRYEASVEIDDDQIKTLVMAEAADVRGSEGELRGFTLGFNIEIDLEDEVVQMVENGGGEFEFELEIDDDITDIEVVGVHPLPLQYTVNDEHA